MNRLFEKMNLFIVVATTSIKIQICIPALIMNSYQSMFYQSSPVHVLLYPFVYQFKIPHSKKVPQSISKGAKHELQLPKCLAVGLDVYNQETNGLSLPCYSRKELSDLWDRCFFGPAQREEFTPAFDGMCDVMHCAANKTVVFPPISFPGFSSTCPGRVGEKPGNEVVSFNGLVQRPRF